MLFRSQEMARLFAVAPQAVEASARLIDALDFRLDALSCAYPGELRAGFASEQDALAHCARDGAKKAGNSLEAELQLLVVHGVLHLLGYDHAKPKEKSKMWKAQREILTRLGLGDIQIREE